MARTERSKQKAREKAKKKSLNRKQTRKRQHESALKAVNAPLSEVAANWDWSECFASEDWHDRGARVRAFAVRSHETGARTAAIFDIDLDSPPSTSLPAAMAANSASLLNTLSNARKEVSFTPATTTWLRSGTSFAPKPSNLPMCLTNPRSVRLEEPRATAQRCPQNSVAT